MRYLLDTNSLSDLLRHPRGAVGQRLRRLGDQSVVISIIVAAEARFGIAKKRSRRLQTQLDEVLRKIELLPFETPADEIYGRLRVELEAAGMPIGGNDMLIAAHALALDCILVTDNEREFRRISGLRVENWLTPADI